MTLSVSAIRNYSPVNYSRNNLQTKQTLKAQPSFGNNDNKNSNGMKKTILTAAIPMALLPGLSSCDKDYWGSYSEYKAIAKAYGKGCCIKPDTVWIKLPGDTVKVPQVIHDTTTVYLKENFKSPVIDTINSILTTLGDDPSKGYVPIKISYIDEMDTKFKKNIIDGQSSSPNLIVYKGTASPFDDNQGRFVVGSPLDKHDRWEFTLTRDGYLYAVRMLANEGIDNPHYPEDFTRGADVYLIEHNAAKKLVNIFNGNGEFLESIKPKENTPNVFEVTNPENTTWNWTNVNVQRADSPDGND